MQLSEDDNIVYNIKLNFEDSGQRFSAFALTVLETDLFVCEIQTNQGLGLGCEWRLQAWQLKQVWNKK